MGDVTHKAIIVTVVNYSDHAVTARAEALKIFEGSCQVSELSEPAVNGYQSFCVFPDGSKLGWDAHELAEEARDKFVAWLDRQRYGDGSTPYNWVEIEYGECVGNGRDSEIDEDDDGAVVTRHFAEVEVSDDYTGPAELVLEADLRKMREK